MIELTVLSVPGCPNAPLLEQRLAEALAGRPAVTVWRVIADADEAARDGMCGSPPLLVNGHDPFGIPGTDPALACRMYQREGGRLEGAPTVEALRRALEQPGMRLSRRAGATGRPGAVGQAGLERLAPAEGGLPNPRSRPQGFSSRPAPGTGLPSSGPSGPASRGEGDRSR